MAEPKTQEDLRRGATSGNSNNGSQADLPPVRRPKKKRRTGLIVSIVIAVVLLIVIGLMIAQRGKTDATVVETQPASTRTIVQTVTATGVIDPETQVKVSPEVSGEIVYLGVQEGQTVTKGQVLVRINPQSMMAQRDQELAAISTAQARAAQSKAGLLKAQQDLARLQQLFDKKLATRQDMDNAQAQVNINQAELEAANFQVAQARASYRGVTESLNKTTIVSPLSGVVTKLNSKLGEKVVGAIQMTGTEIMTIADLSVIESVVKVSETDVVQVSLGDTAEVEVDAIPNQKFRAVVSRIANSPTQSGVGTQEQVTNFEVRLRFLEPDTRFRPGMTATAVIQTDKKANILTVPIQSVTTREKKAADSTNPAQMKDRDQGTAYNVTLEKTREEKPEPIVFVKVGDLVKTRKVQTGIRDDQYIEITSGLKPGEVVVSGSYKAISKDLEDGTHVTVVAKETNAKSPSASGGK
jgi:HlyD family secretion protein